MHAEERGAASPPSIELFSTALGQGDNVTSPPMRTLSRPPSSSPACPSRGPSRTTLRPPATPSLWIPQLSFHLPLPPHSPLLLILALCQRPPEKPSPSWVCGPQPSSARKAPDKWSWVARSSLSYSIREQPFSSSGLSASPRPGSGLLLLRQLHPTAHRVPSPWERSTRGVQCGGHRSSQLGCPVSRSLTLT